VRTLAGIIGCLVLAACGGGGAGGSNIGTDPASGCSGACATATSVLTVADVGQVIAQAVFEAKARSSVATIAVVDRVGNVLAVYRLGPAAGRIVKIASQLDGAGNSVVAGGLEDVALPIDAAAAIAKAITAAYLSTEGNAFSTRTASQIVQQHFNPGEHDQPSGPLFGVQFTQLPCSDFVTTYDGTAPDAGPKRSPLGMAADPGGFPLYKDGTVVGAVGVMADDLYSLDADISNRDDDDDEAIAYAGTFGFAAPLPRRADRITVDGRTLRFSDVDFSSLRSHPQDAPGFASLGPADGALVAVPGYNAAAIEPGLAFGFAPSGIRPDGGVDYPGADAYVFVDDADVPRFPPQPGTDGADALTAAEVRSLLLHALQIAASARAQIRLPQDSTARVTIAVVDTNGAVLGMVRSRDAPVFGADVSVQKARSATLFSSSSAAAFLDSVPDAIYPNGTVVPIGDYVTATQVFFADPTALETGDAAISARAIGNLARPFYPDGIEGTVNGPLSKPAGEWSAFSTGLQLDLVVNAMDQHLTFTLGGGSDVTANCTDTPGDARAANGIQIFPGGVPIYRGAALVGGIGVSGDGVDQDDMIAFLGLHDAGIALGGPGAIGNADTARRADQLTPQGVRLRYVQCPQAPFVDSNATNVCRGK
jgi:uncharacterized protein GlcG (DUF336 family)